MCLKILAYVNADTDEKSLEYARKNVQANGLQNRIKLLRTQPDSLLSLIPQEDRWVVFYAVPLHRADHSQL
jgi:23S rRNA A1618 N6-methylase RlmF